MSDTTLHRHSRRQPLALAWPRAIASGAALALVLAGCGGSEPAPTASPTTSPTATTSPTSSPTASAEGTHVVEQVEVVSIEDVATGLEAPWGITFHQDGTFYVTERDSGRVLAVTDDGDATVLTGAGAEWIEQEVDAAGEGGLLGIALSPEDQQAMYLYLTRADDNAVVRVDLDGDSLGEPTEVLTGIPKADNHNGGVIRFGPDGYLYVGTGDAAEPELAQDEGSLAGSILRIVADGVDDGAPAPDNPNGDEVYSWGHRNVQGLGWAEDGRMFASEFGASEADELNLIEPGRNYGWPEVEGLVGAPDGTELGDTVEGFTYPVAEWRPTSTSSPSGIAVTDEGVYVAALRGEALFRSALEPDGVGEPVEVVTDHGRLRTVLVGPDGALYVVTNNTDGRGEPREGDDRILRVEVAPAG